MCLRIPLPTSCSISQVGRRLHALGDLHPHHVECAFQSFSHELNDRQIERPAFWVCLCEYPITVSSKFQVVIPEKIRKEMGIKVGQLFEVIEFESLDVELSGSSGSRAEREYTGLRTRQSDCIYKKLQRHEHSGSCFIKGKITSNSGKGRVMPHISGLLSTIRPL